MTLWLPQSLQGRLALGLGASLTLLWLIAALATGTILRHEINELSDAVLAETGQRLLPLAVLDIIDRDQEGLSQDIARLRQHDELFTYLVRDDQGRVLIRSHAARDADFPPFQAVGFAQTATHRLYYDSALQGGVTIAVAEPLAHRAEMTQNALMTLALPLLGLIPASLALVLLIVRRSLRPVRGFSASLASRGGGNQTALPGDAALPTEIAPIVAAVNALMGRIQRTLDAERSFAANAAHELRTPVAAALAQTQRLIAETAAGPGRKRAEDIEASLKRLHRLAEKLMQLARAEGGRMRLAQAGDIRPILQMVVQDARRTSATPITLSLPESPVPSDIDPDALAILARNLIENALKHGAGAVDVSLSVSASLRVRNKGPVVPEATLSALTARFQRGNSHADGTGLGLAIVQAIADGATARLQLLSPATGQDDGFEAVVDLQP